MYLGLRILIAFSLLVHLCHATCCSSATFANYWNFENLKSIDCPATGDEHFGSFHSSLCNVPQPPVAQQLCVSTASATSWKVENSAPLSDGLRVYNDLNSSLVLQPVSFGSSLAASGLPFVVAFRFTLENFGVRTASLNPMDTRVWPIIFQVRRDRLNVGNTNSGDMWEIGLERTAANNYTFEFQFYADLDRNPLWLPLAAVPNDKYSVVHALFPNGTIWLGINGVHNSSMFRNGAATFQTLFNYDGEYHFWRGFVQLSRLSFFARPTGIHAFSMFKDQDTLGGGFEVIMCGFVPILCFESLSKC
jgi:hypothetical protein